MERISKEENRRIRLLGTGVCPALASRPALHCSWIHYTRANAKLCEGNDVDTEEVFLRWQLRRIW